MWVDGVLDEARMNTLRGEAGITVVQRETYVLAYFKHRPKRQWYRYLDPHRFVVQLNDDCTSLEINFNPSPGEVAKLRDFLLAQRLRLNYK